MPMHFTLLFSTAAGRFPQQQIFLSRSKCLDRMPMAREVQKGKKLERKREERIEVHRKKPERRGAECQNLHCTDRLSIKRERELLSANALAAISPFSTPSLLSRNVPLSPLPFLPPATGVSFLKYDKNSCHVPLFFFLLLFLEQQQQQRKSLYRKQ